MTILINDLLFSVLGEYHKKHDLTQVPIKVDLLRPMMQERGFADRIIWEKYAFDARNIAAQVTFYKGEMGAYAGTGDYARIQYSETLNKCWERFVLCKEMYHCILDASATDRVANMEDLLKLSEYLVDDAVSTIEDFAAYNTEQDAEILALETLFPLELRQHQHSDYVEKRVSDHQLALRYRIPEIYVRRSMSPSYYSAVQRLRASDLVRI